MWYSGSRQPRGPLSTGVLDLPLEAADWRGGNTTKYPSVLVGAARYFKLIGPVAFLSCAASGDLGPGLRGARMMSRSMDHEALNAALFAPNFQVLGIQNWEKGLKKLGSRCSKFFQGDVPPKFFKLPFLYGPVDPPAGYMSRRTQPLALGRRQCGNSQGARAQPA